MGASAYTRERLEEAARGARTLSEALVRLGVDPRSSTRDYVRERMKKLGVDTSHWRKFSSSTTVTDGRTRHACAVHSARSVFRSSAPGVASAPCGSESP